MHADDVSRPFHHDGWVYEEKYDGWRMVAYKDGTAVRLVSRAGKEHSRRFAELAAALRALPPATLIFDGEVAIVDDKLISIFPARRLAPNGLEAWAQVVERSYEGLVAKDEASAYRGGRTLSWRKVRQRDYRVEERGWRQDADRSKRQ